MGRTPLLWAAARGDHQAVQMLLDHNADPNTMDTYLAPPVSYAADRGHTLCVKLLLEAGAWAEPVLPPGIKLGSPLNCAARNSEDPTLLQYLLTYGAQVDGTGVDGNTALIHAARKDNVRFAILLLDYNANINAVNINRQTPLTTAIMYNSHGVLELLLGHWEEFSTCPRLQGFNLLETTALYADVETVNILAQTTNHFKLKFDAKKYSLSEFAKRLTERVDVTNDLVDAFDELLFILNEIPPARPKNKDILVEKSLLEKCPTLATMYKSEKRIVDARKSKHEYDEYADPNDFDEAGDDYANAIEHSPLCNMKV